MRRARLLRLAVTAALCTGILGLLAGVGDAAMIRYGRLVVHLDGGFKPLRLPRHRFAPITFQGYANIGSTDSGPPPKLEQALVEFDRDGHLDVTGLPSCTKAAIENASTQQARQRCAGSIVGTGHVAALVTLPGQAPVTVSSPLTIFNGPRQGRDMTVLAHAQTAYPITETYVVPVLIEPRHGLFSYRVSFEVPPIAGGYGVLTHVDLKVGRSYRAGGRQHSFLSARCTDNVLETRGRFLFSEIGIVSGVAFKPCISAG